ncbi:MAG: glycopeptide resistance accessory protein VanW [Bacilli bacterium]|nr:glycopeptide resistance accessory protein VanW [Bacilli bacterium]MBP3921169.1 glycopeptide resistance accessory protein VanW [Bacilli bacterium]
MGRKRLTQIFPFLIPIRIWQRNLFYQIGMNLDNNKYSKTFSDLLPYEIAKEKTLMINEESGHDIIYQKNKVDNLKITSMTMNKILIYPNETFSFCYLSKNSKKYGKYKEGLVLIDGKIVPRVGGGICHLSNLLYYTFLHTSLTIVERHGHNIKSFPNPDKDSLDGVDATISSGWLDLKVRNDTNTIYQIVIDFDDDYMYAKILSDKKSNEKVSIINDNFKYVKKNNKTYESVEVVKIIKDKNTDKEIKRQKLYDEVVEVGYELPKDVKVEDK